MSLLSQVKKEPNILPPRVVVYGKSKVGKTTFASGIPGVVFLPAEEGEGILDVPRLPKPESLEDVENAIAELANMDHPYKALCIDTIDAVEPLLWAAVCRDRSDEKKTVETIEDFGYGKGYLYADPYWIRLLKSLDVLRAKRKMVVCLLAHADTKTVNDPVLGAYDVIQTNLHKRANALLHAWADVIGYAEIERTLITKDNTARETEVAKVTGRRVLHTEDRGGFIGGNRYDLPPKLDLSYTALRDAIAGSVAKRLGANKAAKAEKKEAGDAAA